MTSVSGSPSTRTLTCENGAKAKTSDSAECWARRRSKVSSENDVPVNRPVTGSMDPLFSPPRDILPRAPSVVLRRTSSSGFLTGSVRSRTSLTRLKMAVFAPMPRASENTATAVKPGACSN